MLALATRLLTIASVFMLGACPLNLEGSDKLTKPRAPELGCDGPAGDCGSAAASVIRITTTDGDTAGLPATAMPPAKRWLVEIQCAFPNTGKVRVPAGAMAPKPLGPLNDERVQSR